MKSGFNDERLLYIEKSVAEEPLTVQVIQRNPQATLHWIDSYKRLSKHDISENSLTLIRYQGRFLEKCPGTQKHICCNYYVLNWAVGCPFNCTYCYLHGYQNFPGIILHANTSDMIDEVKAITSQRPEQFFRIGTGEFADSLALEKATGFNELVLPDLLKLGNIMVELKTKSGVGWENPKFKSQNSQLKSNRR